MEQFLTDDGRADGSFSFSQRRAAALRRLALDYWRRARHSTNGQGQVMVGWARRLENEARRLESAPIEAPPA